jgi:Ca2+-binding RTX toxin-like protein
MLINLMYDNSVGSAPSGFETAVSAAAQALDSLITNPITVNIAVGYGEYDGAPLPVDVSEGGSAAGLGLTYAQLEQYLQATASSAADTTSVANLPAVDPTGGSGFYISPAQEKAWGLLPANAGEVDGYVGFSSTYPDFNYNPNDRSSPSGTDFVGVVEHELTHALGRISGSGIYTALDLFRYAAPGSLQSVGGQPAYFSIDGGKTDLDNFATTSDYADWDGTNAGPDSFDAFAPFGVENTVTPADITEMDVLGFSIAGNDMAPSAKFAITDTSRSISYAASGVTYSGPVAGLQNQYINITTDNLNISAATPNVFIHSGAGEDGIAALAGTNVLDGGTGSNFLSGGSGSDTFFVDDRNPSADIWSTVVNFHAGDAATVWGVTPQDFALNWVDAAGAPGYLGLTLHASAPGLPTASLTLSGYTSADLGDGKLSVAYGTDPASGSNYMNVSAQS